MVAAGISFAAPAPADDSNDAFLSALNRAGIRLRRSQPRSHRTARRAGVSHAGRTGQVVRPVATTVADNGIYPGLAAFFTGIAISMYCPQMMGSIGNGTFLNMLQDNQGLSGWPGWQAYPAYRDCPDCPASRNQVGLPRARPLGWTCGTSQSDPRPGRRTSRARHRRPLPSSTSTSPTAPARPARRPSAPDDRGVRGARRRRHLHRHRRRERSAAPPSTGSTSTCPATTSPRGIALPGLQERNVLVVDADCRLLPHRRGAAPLRRPHRQRGLPLLAVRNRRRQTDVRVLRPARPEGVVRRHRHRTRALAGDLQRRTRQTRRRPGSRRRTRSRPRRG